MEGSLEEIQKLAKIERGSDVFLRIGGVSGFVWIMWVALYMSQRKGGIQMESLERERAEELIDSVLMMALHMLMNQAPLMVISHILFQLSVDVQAQTFHCNQPVDAMRAVQEAIRMAERGKDGELRKHLQEYQWRMEYGDSPFDKPRVIVRRPESWQELAEAYTRGWSSGFGKEEQEKIYREILSS